MALLETEHSDKLRSYPEKIRMASDRAEILTEQFLAFSGEQVLHPTETNIQALLHEVKRRFQMVNRNDVEIVTKFHPDVRTLWIDAHRFEKSILDIMINALDVMNDQGKIILATEKCTAPELPGDNVQSNVPWIEVSVRDTGPGMPAEIRERIFDPFFMTKNPSKSYGLGLAAVKGFVEQSGGKIAVESEEGRGTCVRMWFPVKGEDAKSQD